MYSPFLHVVGLRLYCLRYFTFILHVNFVSCRLFLQEVTRLLKILLSTLGIKVLTTRINQAQTKYLHFLIPTVWQSTAEHRVPVQQSAHPACDPALSGSPSDVSSNPARITLCLYVLCKKRTHAVTYYSIQTIHPRMDVVTIELKIKFYRPVI